VDLRYPAGLVVCDPPVQRVRTGDSYSTEYMVDTWPYQGGYLDFVPEEEQIRAYLEHGRSGPPRTSFLDDLSFYLQTHTRLVDMSDPDAVSVFIKKIVVSQYLKQTEHLRAILSGIQRGLTRKQDLTRMPMWKVEALWSDMQGWERRMGEYCEDLESIMLQLDIPMVQPSGPTIGKTPPSSAYHNTTRFTKQMERRLLWQDSTADFQYVYHRFRELRHRAEGLNAAVTGLASISGNRLAFRQQMRSIREAKRAKALTILGLLFIPLAFVSSIFSMTEPYGPGGEKFWEYFVVLVPLVVLVFGGYYCLDRGYDLYGGPWSLKMMWQNLRGLPHPRRDDSEDGSPGTELSAIP
jgi:hypothetical protein